MNTPSRDQLAAWLIQLQQVVLKSPLTSFDQPVIESIRTFARTIMGLRFREEEGDILVGIGKCLLELHSRGTVTFEPDVLAVIVSLKRRGDQFIQLHQ